MTPMARNVFLFVANAALWTLNILVIDGSLQLSAKGGIAIPVEIEPSRIKLSIDGKPWIQHGNKQGWISTPAVIALAPGQHKVTVERPGYAAHSFKVLLSGKETLELKTSLEFIDPKKYELEIMGDGPENEELIATVDGGIEEGPLPIQMTDLTAGQHLLEIKFSGLDGFRLKPVLCGFTVTPTQTETSIKINVTRNGKRLKLTGCKKIKEPR